MAAPSPDAVLASHDRSRRVAVDRRRTAAAVCGLTYGAFTYWVESLSSCPAWYEAWHGVALWALVTVVVVMRLGSSMATAIVIGLITQLALLVGYYGVRWLDWGELYASQVAPYALLGLASGPLYGVAGCWLADHRTRHRLAAVVLAGAPFAIDGVNLVRETVSPEWTASHHLGALWSVTIVTLALGVAVVCGLGRSWRDRASAVGMCTLIGLAFSYASFYLLG